MNFENVSPVAYSPDPTKVKRSALAYSCSYRYPRDDEMKMVKHPAPGPQRYAIKDELVKNTRFSKIHCGGFSPKDGLIISKNPGPGHYQNPPSLADVSL